MKATCCTEDPWFVGDLGRKGMKHKFSQNELYKNKNEDFTSLETSLQKYCTPIEIIFQSRHGEWKDYEVSILTLGAWQYSSLPHLQK